MVKSDKRHTEWVHIPATNPTRTTTAATSTWDARTVSFPGPLLTRRYAALSANTLKMNTARSTSPGEELDTPKNRGSKTEVKTKGIQSKEAGGLSS